MSINLPRFIRLSWTASAGMIKSRESTYIAATTLFAAAIISLCGAVALPAHGVATNQPTNIGPEDESAEISVAVWLKLHNEATLDPWCSKCMTRLLQTIITG